MYDQTKWFKFPDKSCQVLIIIDPGGFAWYAYHVLYDSHDIYWPRKIL